MKKVLLLALVAGAIACNTPAYASCHGVNPIDPSCWTHAPGESTTGEGGDGTVGCDFTAFAQETITGSQDTFTGVAHGYVVGNATDTVSVRCLVVVDGTEADSTDAATGTAAATTSGQVTYTAGDTQDVDLCAEWTAGPNGGVVCFETESAQLPPQEVMDVVYPVLGFLCDLTACAPD